jgi:HEAT repeats
LLSSPSLSAGALQDIFAGANVPATILLAVESVNPNECTAALGVLVKLLIPEHAHNELFAQQYIQARMHARFLMHCVLHIAKILSSAACPPRWARLCCSLHVHVLLEPVGQMFADAHAGGRPEAGVCSEDVPRQQLQRRARAHAAHRKPARAHGTRVKPRGCAAVRDERELPAAAPVGLLRIGAAALQPQGRASAHARLQPRRCARPVLAEPIICTEDRQPPADQAGPMRLALAHNVCTLKVLQHDRKLWRSAPASPCAGNLCRHSAFFYRHLDEHGFVAAVIERCQDPDASTRKFACFALGNAAFHSDLLYPKLAPGIRPIVALLSDGNPKTRLNAVGALGNMVRSGEQLVPLLLESGAVKVRAPRVCGAPCL